MTAKSKNATFKIEAIKINLRLFATESALLEKATAEYAKCLELGDACDPKQLWTASWEFFAAQKAVASITAQMEALRLL